MLRHDCAHVLAEAVQELWPDTQVTIGPNIENGHDFARSRPFTPKTWTSSKSARIADHEPITREVWDRAGRGHFEALGEKIRAKSSGPARRRDRHHVSPGRLDGSAAVPMTSTKRPVTLKLMKIAGAIGGATWERDASAHLRHRLADRRTTRRAPAMPRKRKARPPGSAKPWPFHAGCRRIRLLASRVGGFIARCGPHAPPLGGRGLYGSEHAATRGPRSLGR